MAYLTLSPYLLYYGNYPSSSLISLICCICCICCIAAARRISADERHPLIILLIPTPPILWIVYVIAYLFLALPYFAGPANLSWPLSLPRSPEPPVPELPLLA